MLFQCLDMQCIFTVIFGSVKRGRYNIPKWSCTFIWRASAEHKHQSRCGWEWKPNQQQPNNILSPIQHNQTFKCYSKTSLVLYVSLELSFRRLSSFFIFWFLCHSYKNIVRKLLNSYLWKCRLVIWASACMVLNFSQLSTDTCLLSRPKLHSILCMYVKLHNVWELSLSSKLQTYSLVA